MKIQIKTKDGHLEKATHVDRAVIDEEKWLDLYIRNGSWSFPCHNLEKIEIVMEEQDVGD